MALPPEGRGAAPLTGPVAQEGPRTEEIAALAARFGAPRVVPLEVWMGADEFAYLLHSARDGRRSDATIAIPQDGGRFVFIRKYWYPEGLFRLPSGTVRVGEPIAHAAVREAEEETGLVVDLEGYLLRTEVTFRHERDRCPWRSHVFLARPVGGALGAKDTREIKEVVVRSLPEARATQERMLAMNLGGFRYRVRLQEELWDEMRARGMP